MDKRVEIEKEELTKVTARGDLLAKMGAANEWLKVTAQWYEMPIDRDIMIFYFTETQMKDVVFTVGNPERWEEDYG